MDRLTAIFLRYEHPSSVVIANGSWKVETTHMDAETRRFTNVTQYFDDKLSALEYVVNIATAALTNEKEVS